MTRKIARNTSPLERNKGSAVNEEELLVPEEMAELEDEERLQKLRDMFADKSYWMRVERKNPEGRLITICRVPFDDFDPYRIQETKGGGEYIFSLIDDQGRYIKGGRSTWLFDDLPKAPVVTEAKPINPLENPVVVLMMQMMEKNQANLLAMMQTFAPKAGSSDMSQLIEAVSKLKGMTSDKNGNDLSSMVGTFAQLKDLFGSGESKDEGLLSAIKEALPIVQALRGNGGGILPGRPNPRRLSAPPVAIAPALHKGEETVDKLTKAINEQIPIFEKMIRKGDTAEKGGAYLVMALDNVIVDLLVEKYSPLLSVESAWDRLIEAAETPEKVEEIFVYAPSLLPHREWVLGAIKAALDEVSTSEAEPLDDPAGPAA